MKNLFLKIASIVIFFSSISILGQTDANIPYKGITIYIDYPDVPISVGTVQLDSLINGVTYQEPTVQRTFRKYWHEQTKRNVDIQHDIFYYTAPLLASQYDNIGWQNGILLWQEALEAVILNNPNYNWNELDEDENGNVLSVMIISSSYDPDGIAATHYPNWTLSNGAKISKIYGSVLQAPWDTDLNMFMTLHESGHGIFVFPDTYDTEYNSKGTSFYSLMSGGRPEVEPLGGPFLVLKNWGHIIEPTEGTQTITLEADGDSVVVFRNPHDPLEFFTIEARKKSTLGNILFPAEIGLLLWHSDNKVNTSNTREEMTPLNHYMHSIEQADGLFELENNTADGNIGDIYLPGKQFNSTTTPNTSWWAGEASNFELYDIQIIDDNHIQFEVFIPEIHTDHHPEILQSNWTIVSETPAIPGFDATKAIDNDINTFYHVPSNSTEQRPHEIVIDLGDEYTINELYYTANKNNVPPWEGRIKEYKIFISNDINNWGLDVASGTFFRTAIKQYMLFPEKSGKYVKFSAVNSFDSDQRTSIAEINIRGELTQIAGVSENIQDDFKIYPNPVKDVLNLESKIDIENIKIYTTTGKLVVNEFFETNTIDISFLNTGIYFIKLYTQENTIIKKIIKK